MKATLMAIATLGVLLCYVGSTTAPKTPPQPKAAQAIPLKHDPVQATALPASPPKQITIDAIGVEAPVISTSTKADGSLETPPLNKPYITSWYQNGITPGEQGSSVILGHVDSHETGPAVFFQLGKLTQGQRIKITRHDGTVAEFHVNKVAAYDKHRLPITAIYGPSQQAQLRLITCGGKFDQAHASYSDNIVVFASLIAWHKQVSK